MCPIHWVYKYDLYHNHVLLLCRPVIFTGLDSQIERKHIYVFFQRFGEIVRLFVKENKSSATIYFNNSDSAAKAAAAIRQPNKHNFCIEELDSGPRRPIAERDNPQFKNLKTTEEFAGNTTNMYDIHGNTIPTLNGDDGQMYVAVDDLVQSGFRLYTSKPSKLVYTTNIQEYVRIYLKIQMYKFACKYNCHLAEEDKTRIISNISDSVTNFSNDNRENDEHGINAPLRRPKDISIGSARDIVHSSISHTTAGVRQSTANKQQQQHVLKESASAGSKNVNGYVQQDRIKDTPSHVTESNSNSDHQSSNIGYEKKRIEESMSQHLPVSNVMESRVNNYSKPKTTSIDKRCNDETMSQTSTGSDFKRLSKSISVPLNTQLQICVSNMLENSTKIAFVHLTCNREKLERINHDVTSEAAKGPNISPYEGLICAVSYNSSWKRALVRSPDPLRVQLIDYGSTPILPDDTSFRGLSEALQAEPWLCIRACKSNESTIKFEKNASYTAVVTKIYEDGTHIFHIHSQVPNDDIIPKQQFSRSVPNTTTTDFESMDLIPAGTNLARTATSKIITSTPKASTSLMTSKPRAQFTQPTMDDTFHDPSILERLHDGMEVMVEFHFETYFQDNSVVAFICILNWNDEEMEEIEKLTNITSNHMSPYIDISSIKIGDVVAVQSTTGEREIFRCIVCNINNGIYSVAKVDVGTVEDVRAEAIKKLDDEIKNVPYLSCVCMYPDLGDLEDVDLTFNVNSKKQLSQDGPTCKIQGMTVKPWNPLVTHGPSAKSAQIHYKESPPQVPEVCVSETRVTHTRVEGPMAMSLRAGDIIRIINMDFPSRTFFCQTREMFVYYNKEILENIRAAAKDSRPIENPKEKQPVIVRMGAVLYRGVINRVINQSICVRMVDIGGFVTVSSEDILHMDPKFSKKNYGCAQITLEGLDSLENEAVSFLNICIQKKEKFTITAINDTRISVNDNSGNNLLNRLNSMTSKPPGFWFRNLKYVNIPNGVTTLIFSYVNVENGDVYFTVSDADVRGRFAELLSEIPKYCEDAKTYHPSKGEICYAYCMDDWCRAHVISANKDADDYYVFFMDFGNCENISSELIRCLPDQSYGTLPPLCNRFIVQDLKEMYGEKLPSSIGLKLEETLVMGSEYGINVLRLIENNTYEAKIPKITSLLNDDSDDF